MCVPMCVILRANPWCTARAFARVRRGTPLHVAAADLARQLGLISDLGVESNIQVGRLMLYGIGGNKLDKDSELRDVRPDELAALVRQKNLASVVFTPEAEERRLSDQPIDELLRIDVTPGQLLLVRARRGHKRHTRALRHGR